MTISGRPTDRPTVLNDGTKEGLPQIFPRSTISEKTFVDPTAATSWSRRDHEKEDRGRRDGVDSLVFWPANTALCCTQHNIRPQKKFPQPESGQTPSQRWGGCLLNILLIFDCPFSLGEDADADPMPQ